MWHPHRPGQRQGTFPGESSRGAREGASCPPRRARGRWGRRGPAICRLPAGGAAFLAGSLLAVVLPAGPARGATASGTATCTIVSAAEVTTAAALAFGRLRPGTAPGMVVVTPEGARTAQGGVTFEGTEGVSAAAFVVSGAPGAAFTFQLPKNAVLSNGEDRIVVSGLAAGGPRPDAAGKVRVGVGAALHVEAGQPAGSYVGSLPITLCYE